MQTLTVVNNMLATLGETPLQSLLDSHEFKTAALNFLDEQNRQIQARGWWYNRVRKTLPLAMDGTVTIPEDVLAFVADDKSLVKLGNKVHDTVNDSSQIYGDVVGTAVILIPFEKLDGIPATHIAASAVLEFQIMYDGDRARTEILAQKLGRATMALNAEDTRQVRPNLIDNNVRLQRVKRAFTTWRAR